MKEYLSQKKKIYCLVFPTSPWSRVVPRKLYMLSNLEKNIQGNRFGTVANTKEPLSRMLHSIQIESSGNSFEQ